MHQHYIIKIGDKLHVGSGAHVEKQPLSDDDIAAIYKDDGKHKAGKVRIVGDRLRVGQYEAPTPLTPEDVGHLYESRQVSK